VVFPTAVAPYEVVVVPIPSSSGSGPGPEGTANEVVERLNRQGRRVHLDAGEERPGAKYYKWELQGVPVRLEIGRREAASRTATAVDRLGRKKVISVDHLEQEVDTFLAEYDRGLFDRARAAFREEFRLVTTLDELKGFAHVAILTWCGSEECGHAVEQAIDGGLLGTPESDLPIELANPERCISCGKVGDVRWAIAGRPL
jgi:prolyl-tRNA synthetase